MHKVLIGLFFCTAVDAQNLRFAGPISGYVYDAPERSIRVIQGIPGAAYLGAAVVQDVDFASIAPNGRSALIWSGGESSFVPRLDDGAVARHMGPSDVPDLIAWSPDSRAAVLYRGANSRLERWRNLDEAPAVDSPVALQGEGQIPFVAIDSSASKIVWGAENALILWIEGVNAQPLPDAGQPNSAVFSADGKTLFAAGPDRIIALRNLDAAPYIDSLAVSSKLDAAGLVIDGAGKQLYVADRAASSVLVYDTTTGDVTHRVTLDIAPSMMTPLLRPQTFLLNARTGAADTVWLLDTNNCKGACFVGMGVE